MRFPVVYVVCLCLAALALSCKKQHHNVTPGFYYWKTLYRPTGFELGTLRNLSVRKMYLRLFDVDVNEQTGGTYPVAPVRITASDSNFAYVPVVFVTQRALLAAKDTDLPPLAEKICRFSEGICTENGIRPAELQIDCDWTSGTHLKYFRLLQLIRRQPFMTGKLLSCTIRLNQVKYRQSTGIPPVDRGMLMCYGMGNLKRFGPYNSIFEPDGVKDYLHTLNTYPLDMDIALPLYDWCVVFRQGQFRGILHDMNPQEISSSRVFKKTKGNLYTCLQDTVIHGYHFAGADVVRLEQTDYRDLLAVAGYSSARIKNKDLNVLLFSCDSVTLSKFSKDELANIYDRYR